MSEFIVPIITPFRDDNSIDLKKLRGHANFLLSNGVDSLLLAGTTGLGPSLSFKEKLEIMKEFSDIPEKVILQVTSLDLEESKMLAKKAKEFNIKSIAALPPYYYPRMPDEWYTKYYTEISSIYPTIAYNFPLTTGYNISPNIIKTVNKSKGNIIGIKETLPDINHMLNFKWEFSKSFRVYSGPDTLILPAIRSGLDGAVAGTGNYAPELVASIMNDDFEQAFQSQKFLGKLAALSQKYGQWSANYNMVKHLLKYDVGKPRLPIYPLSEDQNSLLSRELEILINEYKR